jgi:hypothetical protein
MSCLLSACQVPAEQNSVSESLADNQNAHQTFDTTIKTIHVFVSLCDNKYQGIVPVPKAIGNGQDPANNLYWGAAYGLKTYFKKSNQWKLVKTLKADAPVLERLVFKSTVGNWYMVADAYDGKYIQQCTIDFLKSCSGQEKDVTDIDGLKIGTKGNSKLITYIGHNGLMDFALSESYNNRDKKIRDAIILACISKTYFKSHLTSANANPLLWTTGLMAPEAYILHDALASYINGGTPPGIRRSAARAYSKYQKCSEKAAMNLLVTNY